jgi:hypothetical protein
MGEARSAPAGVSTDPMKDHFVSQDLTGIAVSTKMSEA